MFYKLIVAVISEWKRSSI